MKSPNRPPPIAPNSNCPAIVDPTPNCLRRLYPPTRPMRSRNGPGLMNTDIRSPMITSGVAIPAAASRSITRVIAIPAIRPASNPAATALDRLMTRSMNCRGVCAKRVTHAVPLGPRDLIYSGASRQSTLAYGGGCVRSFAPLRVTELGNASEKLKRIPYQRCNDASAGDESSAQRAGNLRFAARASSMIDRDLEDAQTCPRRFHLHLQIPAVSHFFHRQLSERIAPDRAEWAHVSVRHTVKESQNPAGHSSGENLLEIHAARLRAGRAFESRSQSRACHKQSDRPVGS